VNANDGYALQLRIEHFGRQVVTRGKLIHLLSSVAMISLLAGCGGNDDLTLQNQPAPASTSPSIVFNPAPVGSITLIGTAPITAIVSNDPTKAGVDWALLCQNTGNCGTLAPLHTASGKPTTYKPPATVTGNSQTVTIEAFAAANHDSNVVTSLTVTGFANNLKGNYVFETKGEDANGPYQLAGVVVLDGKGNVTSGEQTHNDPLISVSDAITGGSYYIGSDGRGTLTINTADQNIGQAGIENLAMVVLSNSHALIGTFDNLNLSTLSYEVSYGTLDLQSSKTAPTGGYAFVMNGFDISTLSMAMGGVMNIDSPNTISGAGSVADQDDSGTPTLSSTLTGTLTSPDSFGSLKFNLTAKAFAPSMQFTGYIVDSTHIKLIESDNAGSGVGFGITAGVAIGQGAATGTFTSGSAFAGNYVFDIVGEDIGEIPYSLASDGQFTADSSGNLTNGYDDEIMTFTPVVISDSFIGTYTLDSSGTGRVDTGPSINFTVNGPGPELIFYLTGNGNPPLILDADDNDNSLGVGSTGTGFAHPQAVPPYTFNGRYGLEFGENNGSPDITTATGQATVNGTAATLAGVIDTNVDIFFSFAPTTNTPLTGFFGTIPSTGRFTGTLTNTFFPPASADTISVAFYPVDPNLVFFIETDYAVTFQSTFGYFSTRTPVCTGCP
jgi:hypothetical protein